MGSDCGQLREWDPKGVDLLVKVSTNPWTNGILPLKTIELICVALNAACTNLQPNGTRRHIRAALEAGATREEILMVLKMGFGLAIHSCSLGAPILLEEAKEAGVKAAPKQAVATPACDTMRAIGQWNTAWDPFFELDPLWTDQFFAFGASIYQGNVFTQKEIEFFSIAARRLLHPYVRAGYAPAHQDGAQARCDDGGDHGGPQAMRCPGVEACNLGVSILAEELERFRERDKS